MTTIVNGTTGITFSDSSVQNTAAIGFRNRIINGGMVIDQRNAGASVTNTTSQVFAVDRFSIYGAVSSKFTAQQNAGSVTPPAGFTNYLGCTSSSAYSVGSGDSFSIYHNIEGFNLADFGWGTASAQTATISFWARSSLTGTFSVTLRNNAQNRSYPATYTISAANTWEYKTITIPGETSGTWVTNNGLGVAVIFNLGSGAAASTTANAWASANFVAATGATSVVGTNGATFYITGVQLEKGTTASSFDFRSYGTELGLCQRYCVVDSYDALNEPVTSSAFWETSTSVSAIKVFPTKMRSAPSISVPTIGAIYALEPQVAWRQASALTVNEIGTVAAKVAFTVAANSTWGTFGRNSSVIGIRSSGTIIYSAEL